MRGKNCGNFKTLYMNFVYVCKLKIQTKSFNVFKQHQRLACSWYIQGYHHLGCTTRAEKSIWPHGPQNNNPLQRYRKKLLLPMLLDLYIFVTFSCLDQATLHEINPECVTRAENDIYIPYWAPYQYLIVSANESQSCINTSLQLVRSCEFD